MLEAEHMGNRAVDPGELAHHFQGVAPAGAKATVLLVDLHRQQAAAAQLVTLGFRRAAQMIAFGGGSGKLGGERPGDLQRGFKSGCRDGGHRLFLRLFSAGKWSAHGRCSCSNCGRCSHQSKSCSIVEIVIKNNKLICCLVSTAVAGTVNC
ncbi:hypothetical protein D3C85_1232220 [compost metagenome]